MAYNSFDENYKKFLRNLSDLLDKNLSEDGRSQRQLIDSLIKAESKFRTTLYKSNGGYVLYRKFGEFIMDKERNILKARSYFRERQNVFIKKISPLFSERDFYSLRKFRINHKFARWAMENYEGSNKKELQKLFDEITHIRNVLCEDNIPLAINGANIFWSKIKYSRLDHIDIVQAASEGLLNAIDKFVPSGKKAGFRHVSIGRMTLNMMTEHNQTAVSMSPSDRRILYRCNLGKKRGLQGKDLLKFVKQSFPSVQESTILDLIAAETMVQSTDQKVSDDSERTVQDILPDEVDAEEQIIQNDLQALLYRFIDELEIIERKIVRMKFGL